MAPVSLRSHQPGWAPAALALVLVACGGGGGGGSTPPTAPSGLVASGVTATSLQLCWSPAPDATDATTYSVLLGAAVQVGGVAGPCATLSGLTAGRAYAFTVTATDGKGQTSAPSPTLSVTTAPAAPGGLATSYLVGTTFRLCWKASAGARTYAIAQDGAVITPTRAWGTCATIGGLTPTHSYAFTVTALDAKGQASEASSPLSVRMGPQAPSALVASAVTSHTLHLCWTAPGDATRDTTYAVRAGWVSVTVTADTCTAVEGLSPNLTYDLAVMALDGSGRPSDPAVLPVTTPDGISTCSVPPAPPLSSLIEVATLPDPFRMLDGGRMTRLDQWACRQAQIAELVQGFELGPKPAAPAPGDVVGSYDGATATLTVSVTVDGKTRSFDARIRYPATPAPAAGYPAIIGVNASSLDDDALAAQGVAVITFPADDVAQQKDGTSRGKGKFYELYGGGHEAGAMMAWSWGISRLIDVLASAPSIDTSHLGVTGCSRNGKGALVAGAFDPRIALTIPQESGAGGAASWRVSEHQGTTVQTLGEIVGENVWFTPGFSRFATAVDKVPFDQHEIAALIAPRGLLVLENSSMVWLGNLSTYVNGAATRMVWDGLGAKDRMGYSQLGGHDHCAFPAAQQPKLDAFVQRFLLAQDVSTDVFDTDTVYAEKPADWIDWEVPTLAP